MVAERRRSNNLGLLLLSLVCVIGWRGKVNAFATPPSATSNSNPNDIVSTGRRGPSWIPSLRPNVRVSFRTFRR